MRITHRYEPLFLGRMVRVWDRQGKRIAENGRRLRKGDAVLAEIACSLPWIPLEYEGHDGVIIADTAPGKQGHSQDRQEVLWRLFYQRRRGLAGAPAVHGSRSSISAWWSARGRSGGRGRTTAARTSPGRS